MNSGPANPAPHDESPSERLYTDLAPWWPLMSSPDDYEEEATIYSDLLQQSCSRPIESLLELGSGGGNNAFWIQRCLPNLERLVLTDLSEGMLAVNRALNPACEHRQGDMRTVRLEQQFDAVFVHDAVCYMCSREDLASAIETAWLHTAPGGAALFAPDYVSETFPSGKNGVGGSIDEGGHDEDADSAELSTGECPRGLRFLAWCWDPDPSDELYVTDYAYLVRERDGSVTTVHDRHLEGLFSREVWLQLLRDQGFEPTVVPLEHSEVEAGTHEMFVAKRP